PRSLHHGFRRVVFAAAIAISYTTGVFAQSATASLSGTVTDDTGGALPGVTITIVNKANGVAQTQVTNAEGRYRVLALPPAPYEIRAELTGFSAVTREVTLRVGTDGTVDLKLAVGGLAENLTVTGEAPLVEVTKSQPSSVVEASQLQALPTITRNFLTL